MICCIFNFPPHYREEIYKKIEKNFNVNFYFGNIEEGKIKKMDYSLFLSDIKDLHTIKFMGSFSWIKGSLRLCFLPYNKYIITGEPYCVSSWFVLIINRLLGKDTYTWTHGWYGSERGIKKLIKKIYFKLPKVNLLYGNRAKILMSLEGIPHQKLKVIYNSLDYENQIIIRKDLVLSDVFSSYFEDSNPVILFTGRITKVKKLEQLILALYELKLRNRFYNLFIIGNGSELNSLRELVSLKHLEKQVCFYGECYDESLIANFYHNALCCVSPGNVGLTGLHAMTYGCPVISHDNFSEQMPEFEAINEGISGFFFEQDNLYSLCSKIELLNRMDREKVRIDCYGIVDSTYNSQNQINILKEVLS